MARPAGFSSEEEFSDDGLTLYHDDITPKKYVYKRELQEEVEDPNGEKLISAVIDNKISEVTELINNEIINYKSKNFGNWTALMHACSQGNPEMVELLLKHGANPKDHFQLMTPLLCACNSNNIDEIALLKCVSLLLEHGAPLNERDWYNVGPLTHAVRKKREKLTLKLISMGCDVDSEDSDGWTPIFYAVDGGFTNLVQILKDAGACLRRIDHNGRTLHDIATAKFYKHIAEMVNVTGKLVDIDDIIEQFKDYKRMSSYQCILSELPDKKKGRFYGFSSDAARWVHGIGLDTLVKNFIVKQVQLGQILTMDDKELKDIGVELSYDRVKIKYCVQNFHQHSWGKNCLIQIKDDIDLHTTAQVICNAIKQLHLVSTATYFWKKNNGHELCQSKKDCISKGLYYTRFFRKEINCLLQIMHEIEEEDDIKPCDLILPLGKGTSPWFSKKTVLTTMILLTVVYKTGKYLYPLVKIPEFKFPYKILYNLVSRNNFMKTVHILF